MEQSANTKRIAKNTMMLYVRMLFGMLVSLYTSRVVLSTLCFEDMAFKEQQKVIKAIDLNARLFT
jgi:hypothetical protein